MYSGTNNNSGQEGQGTMEERIERGEPLKPWRRHAEPNENALQQVEREHAFKRMKENLLPLWQEGTTTTVTTDWLMVIAYLRQLKRTSNELQPAFIDEMLTVICARKYVMNATTNDCRDVGVELNRRGDHVEGSRYLEIALKMAKTREEILLVFDAYRSDRNPTAQGMARLACLKEAIKQSGSTDEILELVRLASCDDFDAVAQPAGVSRLNWKRLSCEPVNEVVSLYLRKAEAAALSPWDLLECGAHAYRCYDAPSGHLELKRLFVKALKMIEIPDDFRAVAGQAMLLSDALPGIVPLWRQRLEEALRPAGTTATVDTAEMRRQVRTMETEATSTTAFLKCVGAHVSIGGENAPSHVRRCFQKAEKHGGSAVDYVLVAMALISVNPAVDRLGKPRACLVKAVTKAGSPAAHPEHWEALMVCCLTMLEKVSGEERLAA